jgi:hypothetical protein
MPCRAMAGGAAPRLPRVAAAPSVLPIIRAVRTPSPRARGGAMPPLPTRSAPGSRCIAGRDGQSRRTKSNDGQGGAARIYRRLL